MKFKIIMKDDGLPYSPEYTIFIETGDPKTTITAGDGLEIVMVEQIKEDIEESNHD